MKLTGNTIFISGGTSGIGRALAEAFHSRGNRVIISGRRQSLLDEITAGQVNFIGVQLDLNDPNAVVRFKTETLSSFPDINVLIANAGISRTEEIAAGNWDLTYTEEMIDTNIKGVIRITEALLPVLKTNADAAILATSSALAFVPRADYPTYCATKAFLHSWLQSIRHQLRLIPIEVVELAPPYVRTALTGIQQATDLRAMPVTEYVEEVFKFLEQNHYQSGEIILERDSARRWAERDGRYQEMFAALNPS